MSPPTQEAAGPLSLEQLETEVRNGTIESVVLALVDMQGRLMGKRVQSDYFVERATDAIDVCSSLLTLDMESDTTPGYTVSSIDVGYPDFPLYPDLATLRRMPWHAETALVLADPRWHDGTPGRRVAATGAAPAGRARPRAGLRADDRAPSSSSSSAARRTTRFTRAVTSRSLRPGGT